MSGTICHLPGAFGVPDGTLEASSRVERVETSDQDRVRRVIELYRRLQAVPPGTFDEEGAASVVRALTEGRESDALALLDIALEEPDSDFEPADEVEDPYGTPIPHAAMIWR